MHDKIIRQAFHYSILSSEHDNPDTFVVDELGLKNGEIRADIAVLNGKLIGYEIKTEKDNLTRLPSQVSAYNEVFYKSYLIVSKNHLLKAVESIPEWWGIYIIVSEGQDIFSFSLFRIAKANKRLKTFSLAQLLWKEEALEVANKHLKHNIPGKTTKHEIYEIISGTCSSMRLSKIVIKYLKQRENWRKDLTLPL